MTCLEKWKEDHPGFNEVDFDLLIEMKCPGQYGYMPHPDCAHTKCVDCWDREIPASSNEVEETVEDAVTTTIDISEPTILDSGNRTQFESGAVRDMREGKGRCDLIPLEVVADLMCGKDVDRHCILTDIAEFKRSGCTGWLQSALYRFANAAYDGCVPTMILDVAKHYEDGAKKYGPDNWQKGIPVWCYIDSAARHYIKWVRGDNDEPHNRAFVWNLLCCIWEVDHGESWRDSQSNMEGNA